MDVKIENVDILSVEADLIVLKYADGFHGADLAVAKALKTSAFSQLGPGEFKFLKGSGIKAREAVFIGVGPLYRFRYPDIQRFGRAAIKMASEHSKAIEHIALTIHGPGYGLDSEKALLSLVAGLVSEWKGSKSGIRRVTIAEKSPRSFEALSRILEARSGDLGLASSVAGDAGAMVRLDDETQTSNLAVKDFGTLAEAIPRLFVAMPFAEEFTDEFEIGFREAARASGFLCERLDLESFTGDVVAEIKKRILESHGVVALLNSLNPNVFLEIGYSWAHNKQTILVARTGTKLPFDVQGHRCILYKNINELRGKLSHEIASIKAQGGFSK